MNSDLGIFRFRRLKRRRNPAQGNALGFGIDQCALEGRRNPPPLQGAPINSETEGVALGWIAAALSAPKSKDVQIRIHESYGWPFMTSLLVSIFLSVIVHR